MPRTVHHCMGTVFSIDVRPDGFDTAIAEVCTWLDRVDAIFSTYRPDSDISRLNAGSLSLANADPLVAEVLGLCAQAQQDTDGYFSTRYDGGLDPTGLVKGWAIERASSLLRAAGAHDHSINGGGDLQTAGEAAPGEPWRTGIVYPADRTRLLIQLETRDGAIATSGAAERGSHLIDPFTGRPAQWLTSVTIVGPALTQVDVAATAVFVMGRDRGLAWLARFPELGGVLVDSHGTVATTPNIGRWMHTG